MSEPRPVSRTDGLLTETLDGELLVYDLAGDTALHLNRTAALVWRSCDGQRTVADLAMLVAEELGEPPDEDVVLMALDNLADHGLISAGYKERAGADVALSRRRFFQRVGLAGGTALSAPVVYSALVPTAAAALSHGGGGGGGGGGGIITPTPSGINRNSSLSNSGTGPDDNSGGGSDDNYP
jgi:coenzyme PQQ synthesis protein D (PqqD)